MRSWVSFSLLVCLACVSPLPRESDSGTPQPFGPIRAGSYHLGPVDFEETMWTNACAPYPDPIRRISGRLLAGVDQSLNAMGQLCDACALITTRRGASVTVQIVTSGVSKSAGDLDLSPEAFTALGENDPQGTSNNPRPMTWQLVGCPARGPIQLQYQTQANTDWTSFWVRAARLPIERVEVQSSRHSSFVSLQRSADGAFTLNSGFGPGPFTLKISGAGLSTTQRFDGFSPGSLVPTTMQLE